MDLPTLASVLQLALSANPEERKAGEERLTQYQHAPGHLVGLMQIVVRTDVDIAIRQIASIYFKNLVSRDWEQEDGKPDVFAASDKSMVRDNLLEAIICAPPAIRSQLQECLKAVVNADYPERWPALLLLIDGNLKSRDQQRTYGALVALRVLSRKYETSKRSRSPARLSSGGRMEPYQFCPWDGQLYQEGVPFCEHCGCARFSGSRAEKYRPPWRKILYEAQPYEDNYTDHTFLASLVTNANVVKRDYWSVVRSSLVVSQQLCTVVMVAVVASSVLLNQARHASRGVASSCEPWTGAQGLESLASAELAHPQAGLEGGCWENTKCRDSCAGAESCKDLREPRGGTSMLLVLDAALLWAGFAVLVWANRMRTNCTRSGPRNDIQMTDACVAPLQQGPGSQLSLRNLFSCFLFFSGICILSPILQTLTRSISSDTICTSTVFLLIIHLVFHDYSYSHAVTAKFTGNVSLMAAIFASVLVASRLESQTAVFALVLFCLEFFVLFPAVLHEIKQRSTRLHLSFSLAMVVPTVGLLYRLSGLLAGLFVFTLLFVTFLCPYWLVKIQKLKYEITGPWDEAKLMVASQ